MAIQYDFQKLPQTSAEEENVRLFPKAVKRGTVSFYELAQEIEKTTTYTVADLEGMMEAVAHAAASHLNNSEHVELKGLGTLSVAIACNRDEARHMPVITSPSQVTPRDLHVSRVNFDAKPVFMRRLTGPFEQAHERFPSNKETDVPVLAERRALLLGYLESHGYISTSQYMRLTHFTRSHARDELNAFVHEGLLRRSGAGTHLVFVKS